MEKISIPHEAVKEFIRRFNKRAVFTNLNINCPNVLDPKSQVGQKLSSIMKSKYTDKNGDLLIDIDTWDNIGYTDLVTILQLCYLNFSMICEKSETRGFEYITTVYKEVLNLVKE